MRNVIARISATAAAAVILAGIGIPAAQASAPIAAYEVDCSVAEVTQLEPLVGHVGETFTVKNIGDVDCDAIGPAVPVVSGFPPLAKVAAGATATYGLVAETDGATVSPRWSSGSSVWNLSITILPADSASVAVAEESAGPAAHLQQVTMPSSGSCADVQDADLKWGTDVTGGWTRAWADWANAFVCSRTLTNAGGTWHAA